MTNHEKNKLAQVYYKTSKRQRQREWGKLYGKVGRFLGKASIQGSKSKISMWIYSDYTYYIEDWNH